MSFFDNLSGLAGDVGGWAGQASQSISQIGNAISQLQGGYGNHPPPQGTGTSQPIHASSTSSSIPPVVLIGGLGLLVYLLMRKR